MSSVAPYPHKRGQLVSVHSRQWIVNGECLNTFSPSILSQIFDPFDKLNAFFGSMRSGATFTADVKNIRSCFRFAIENEDDLPRRFTFKEATSELRTVRVVANEAAQTEGFIIPQNMQVPEASVIRSLFKADGDRDATSREDLGMWSDSKGKRLESRAVAVEARKVADRVIAIVQPVEPLRPKPQRLKVNRLFSEQ